MSQPASAFRLAKLAGVAALSNISSLKLPYKLTFSITYWCQSRCLTCNIWQIRPKGELSLDEIKEFANRNNYFKWIEITGGEPFLRSDIVEVVKSFVDSCKDLYLVTIPTNSLTNSDLVIRKIESILKLGIPKLSITVSLDGHRELHDKIRGVKGNYDKAIAMFKRLKELKKTYGNLFFVFGYTMSSYNQGELLHTYEEVKKDIPEVTPNDFHVNLGQLSDIYYSNSNMDILPQFSKAADELDSFISKRNAQFGAIPLIESAFLKKLIEYIRTGKVPVKSRSLDASLFIDSFGNVFPSIMWDKKLGNIKEFDYDLRNIWHSAIVEETRKLVKEGKEPKAWTACEAYQSLVGNIGSLI